MPRNGSGTWTRLYDWTTDRDNGVKIDSTRMDAEMDDMATGLSNSIAKDGQTTITANLPMAGFRHTGVGNASARSDYAATGQVQDGSFIWCGTGGGTVDVITLTPSPAITAYAAGQTFRFLSSGANTGATTVNISTLGAKSITKNGTTALAAGNIPSGAIVQITYDGTQFQITKTYDIGTSGAYVPLLNGNNTFSGTGTYTGLNTFSTTSSGVAPVTLECTDAGASGGPLLPLYRNSASPAASDALGIIPWDGKDSGGTRTTYGRIYVQIDDPTDTSEDGQMVFDTIIAGSLGSRMRLASGLFLGSATGGDLGTGTINATAVYDDGVKLVNGFIALATGSGTGTTIDVDFDAYTGYKYKHLILKTLGGGSTANINAQISTDGGGTWSSSAFYASSIISSGSTLANTHSQATAGTNWLINPGISMNGSSATTSRWDFKLYENNLTTIYHQIKYSGSYISSTGDTDFVNVEGTLGYRASTVAITDIRFTASNSVSYAWALYGAVG